jgi:hypothetical protein
MADMRVTKGGIETKVTHWLLGVVLGAFAGGFVLEAGVLALLLLVPALVWGRREPTRPLGLAGLLVGIGCGVGGLLALADQRCATDASCSMPDQTPYFVFALVMVAAGAAFTVAGLRRALPSAD